MAKLILNKFKSWLTNIEEGKFWAILYGINLFLVLTIVMLAKVSVCYFRYR